MGKTILYISAFFCISLGLHACKTSDKVVSTDKVSTVDIPVRANHVYTDKFDYIYIISDLNEVYQYESDGTLRYKYANRLTGTITHLDVTNPQKILAFVKDFGTLIILDNTLTEVNKLNFADEEYPEITTAAMSNDGNYWLCDEANWRLIKVADDGSILAESNRLTDYGLESFTAKYMLARENRVYISTESGQLLIFDNFGQYLSAVSLPDIDKFLVVNDEIQFLHGEGIRYYNPVLLTDIKAKVNPPSGNLPVIDFDYNTKGLILLTKTGIQLPD